MNPEKSSLAELKKAVKIGFTCIGTYLISYCLRNLLSVTSLQILQNDLMTKESLGFLTSVYFIVYAAGQLLNGIIGDSVKPRYMVFFGLMLGGAATLSFPLLSGYPLKLLCFAVMGFGLSMLRGPLVKTISENNAPGYARILCVFLSSASFAGPLVAGIIAGLFRWNYVFIIFGIITLAAAFVSYVVLSLLEQRKIIEFRSDHRKSGNDIFAVFRIHNFMVYMLIGIVVEVSASSITFWIPAYMSERLMLSNEASTTVYSVIALTKSLSPFICLLVLKLFRDNDIKMMRAMFMAATILYFGMNWFLTPLVNIVLFMTALFFTSCASALLWSVYIPGLAKSGKVSSANGILDFTGYVGASVASAVFSSAMPRIGWNGVTYIWCGFMLFGFITACITKAVSRTDVTEN